MPAVVHHQVPRASLLNQHQPGPGLLLMLLEGFTSLYAVVRWRGRVIAGWDFDLCYHRSDKGKGLACVSGSKICEDV